MPLLKEAPSWRIPDFRTIDELRRVKIGDYAIGQNAVWWLFSQEQSIHTSLERYRDLLVKVLQTTASIYHSAVGHLEQERYDRVYIFNGRCMSPSAWVAACKNKGVTYFTHERLSSSDHYHVVREAVIHDLKYMRDTVEKLWDVRKEDPRYCEAGKTFFEERPAGRLTGWTSFTALQIRNRVPCKWAQKPERLAVFTSTEWELGALEEIGAKRAYGTQLEILKWLLPGLLRDKPQLGICVRVHPNSKGDTSRWWEELSSLGLEALEVIDPEGSEDSYAILREATSVLTFGSSMGIEATYWGKPSVMFGVSTYMGIGAVWEPTTKEELATLLTEPKLERKPVYAAIKFGAFCRQGGEKYRHAREVDSYCLTFKGVLPHARPEVRRILARHFAEASDQPLGRILLAVKRRLLFSYLRCKFGWHFGANYV